MKKAKNSILNLDRLFLLARVPAGAWGPDREDRTYAGGGRPGGRLGSKGTVLTGNGLEQIFARFDQKLLHMGYVRGPSIAGAL